MKKSLCASRALDTCGNSRTGDEAGTGHLALISIGKRECSREFETVNKYTCILYVVLRAGENDVPD